MLAADVPIAHQMLFLILLIALRCVFGNESLLRVKHSATGRGGCCQDTCSGPNPRLVRRPHWDRNRVWVHSTVVQCGDGSRFCAHESNIDTLSAGTLES